MMKKFIRKTIFVLAVLFVLSLAQQNPALARTRRYVPPAPKDQMKPDKRPWAGTPWLVTGVLAAGAVVLGFKNARRSFRD